MQQKSGAGVKVACEGLFEQYRVRDSRASVSLGCASIPQMPALLVLSCAGISPCSLFVSPLAVQSPLPSRCHTTFLQSLCYLLGMTKGRSST